MLPCARFFLLFEKQEDYRGPKFKADDSLIEGVECLWYLQRHWITNKPYYSPWSSGLSAFIKQLEFMRNEVCCLIVNKWHRRQHYQEGNVKYNLLVHCSNLKFSKNL